MKCVNSIDSIVAYTDSCHCNLIYFVYRKVNPTVLSRVSLIANMLGIAFAVPYCAPHGNLNVFFPAVKEMLPHGVFYWAIT